MECHAGGISLAPVGSDSPYDCRNQHHGKQQRRPVYSRYALFHSSIGKQFNRIEAKLGVKNLFDKLYYLSEGYPMEGRLFYASLSYTFNSQ